MNAGQAIYTIDEFERESRHIETMIWEAMAIEPGMKVLFCGYGPDGNQVRHAMNLGIDVTVIEHRARAIADFANLGAKFLRGSTSVIPAKENAFDVGVSFHYLHEIDPFFHAQVLSELARVARRVAIVEPAPPGDALGKRIALLYSQAKRELGQFEYYQPLEYWKKLLQAVKADVAQHVFAFSKVPPREYLIDTIRLLLDTMKVEETPQSYIEELQQIARRSNAQLLPPPRYVLVGAALGELPAPHFSPVEPAAEPPPKPAVIASRPPVAPVEARQVTPDAGYEFPPVEAPQQQAQPPPAAAPAPAAQAPPEPAFGFGAPASEPPPAFVPGLPFGAPAPPGEAPPPSNAPNTPFGAPFAMPAPDPFGKPPAGIPPSSTWEWEPPDGGGEDDTPFKP